MIKRFLKRGWWDAERARELDAYLAAETDDNIARGMTPGEARTAARRKLGNTTLVREEIYQMNTVTLIDSAWRDLKHGARLLRLNPAFAVVAVLSLALGIGANTAIFQLLDAVRIRTLPVEQPWQLVDVRIEDGGKGRTGQFTGRAPQLTYPLFQQIRDRQEAFSGLAAWGTATFNMTTSGEARYARGIWVERRVFRHARREAAPRPPPHQRGRCARLRRAGGRPQLRFLAARIRRRRVEDRPAASARRTQLRDRRRHAGAVLRH